MLPLQSSRPLDAAGVGELLRTRRKQRGLTQSQVAAAVGLSSQSYLSLFENGHQDAATSVFLPAFIRVLGLSAEDVRAISPKHLPPPPPVPFDFRLFVEQFAPQAPELRDGVVQTRLLQLRVKEGPLEPEQWWDLYRAAVRVFGSLSA